MTALVELAPAKVNLYLHVTGRRADGYHLLESLVGFTDIADRLEAEPADAVTLSVQGNPVALPPGQHNIVVKTAHLLKDTAGVKAGAAIRLHKHLPVAAGIGGGSADAAAAIRLLTRLWKLSVSQSDVDRLALTLGADVPACLRSHSLYMGGIGETIETGPPLSALYLVLVNCGRPLATKDVFTAWRGPPSQPDTLRPASFGGKDSLMAFLREKRNDLTLAAMEKINDIKLVIDALKVQPDCLLARMSGSGATCFGVFGNAQMARRAETVLKADYPHWWIQGGMLK